MKGHIRKRSKHSYSLIVTVGYDAKGNPKQKWLTYRGKKKDAEEELARIVAEINSGSYVEPSKMTVGVYLEQWLEDYASAKVSMKTLERYTGIVRQHLCPALGAIPLPKLQPLAIQSYYAEALRSGRKDGREGGLSPRTVLHHHRVLHEALATAVRLQVLGRNPADAVDPPRVPDSEVAALDEDATIALWEAAEGTSLYIPVLLASGCGLRRGEIVGLQWSDMNWTVAELTIRRSIEETSAGVRIKEPKSRRGRRKIAVPDVVLPRLAEHRRSQEELRTRLGAEYNVADWICCSPSSGELWTPSAFTSAYRALVRRRGLTGPNFHALRHSHASQMLRNGTDIKTVSARLGHSRTAFTLDTYAHLLPGQDADAARRTSDAIEAAMNRRKNSR